MIIKVSTQQEDLTIVNTHAPNTGAANYISQFITKLKKHSNNNTTLVGDINTPITAMDKSPKQTNKEAKALMTHWNRWASQIYSKYSILKQQNIHSSQVHTEHSPE